ncbi:hypothetical protein CEUSTIGMA_g8577.t1 [Chlamydomonas eustigma]|uniref:Bromo domain-containing protein n=1 Tax=Chlamydomonas eustigma TaxID=1157962 RepID=A0A250XDI5_9CHLO|nr:hypothetical protein CEUSTIGMA_g8577.t1 [Chlamydomonas eustigma]|eukprot:GAX81144.1 hypothetical protein CEUSTIGMA_g8577.t1 [Chlamydomonas eustigma]
MVAASSIISPAGSMIVPNSFEPSEYVAAVLQKLVAIDREGYFKFPVDEKLHQAPNYYTIIKQPMCFQEMKDRLASGIYTSFRQFKDDFELISTNAKTFNKSTTKAFSLICSGTYTAAGAQMTGAASFTPAGVDITNSMALPLLENGVPGGDAAAGEATSNAVGAPWAADDFFGPVGSAILPISLNPHAPPTFHGMHGHANFLPPQSAPLQSWPNWLTSPQPLCTYLSDEDEGTVPMPLTVIAPKTSTTVDTMQTVPEDQPGPSSHRRGEPLDDVIHKIRCSTQYQKWDVMRAPAGLLTCPASSTASLPPAANAQPTSNSKETAPSDSQAGVIVSAKNLLRTAEWKQAGSSIEWQCHWLELRMRELSSQRERLLKALAAVPEGGLEKEVVQEVRGKTINIIHATSALATEGVGADACEGDVDMVEPSTAHGDPQAAHAASIECPMVVPAAFPNSAALQRQKDDLMEGLRAMLGTAAACDKGKKILNSQRPPVHAGICFFQARTGACSHSCSPALLPGIAPLDTAADVSTDTPTTSAPPAHALPLPSLPAQKQAPALIYTTCDMLSQQLHQLRSHLTSAFPGFDRPRGMSGAGHPTGGPSGRAMASRQHATGIRRTNSTAARGGGGGAAWVIGGFSVLTGRGGDGMKRKRSEMPDGLGDALGSPSLRAERTGSLIPAVSIFIPPVRELAEEEMLARRVAMTTWSEEYQTYGDAALTQPPPEVQAVLQQAVDAGEGSSSEDTSDELYLHMHQVMAEEEQRYYAELAAKENQRKKTGQGGGGQGGTKTPRGGGAGKGQQQTPSGGAAGSASGYHVPSRRSSVTSALQALPGTQPGSVPSALHALPGTQPGSVPGNPLPGLGDQAAAGSFLSPGLPTPAAVPGILPKSSPGKAELMPPPPPALPSNGRRLNPSQQQQQFAHYVLPSTELQAGRGDERGYMPNQTYTHSHLPNNTAQSNTVAAPSHVDHSLAPPISISSISASSLPHAPSEVNATGDRATELPGLKHPTYLNSSVGVPSANAATLQTASNAVAATVSTAGAATVSTAGAATASTAGAATASTAGEGPPGDGVFSIRPALDTEEGAPRSMDVHSERDKQENFSTSSIPASSSSEDSTPLIAQRSAKVQAGATVSREATSSAPPPPPPPPPPPMHPPT